MKRRRSRWWDAKQSSHAVLHSNDVHRDKQVGTILKVDEGQAAIVREIFGKYADGGSMQAIASELNQRNVPSAGSTWKRKKYRASGWARSAIWTMLRNRLYHGVMLWNRFENLKFDNKEVKRKRPASEVRERAVPHLRIVDEQLWHRVHARVNHNKVLKPDDKRHKSGGKAKYLLSGLLKCECGANFVMDSNTHYRCGKALDGESCTMSSAIRVRRDVAERVILQPIVDKLLSPEMISEMVAEMRKVYAAHLAAKRASVAQVPAEIRVLDDKMARLRKRLTAGDDPDISADDITAVIDRLAAQRGELLAARPESRKSDKLLAALPAAARAYRDQIKKGTKGDDAARARFIVRRLMGDITLKPSDDRTHLVAHGAVHRHVLLATGVLPD